MDERLTIIEIGEIGYIVTGAEPVGEASNVDPGTILTRSDSEIVLQAADGPLKLIVQEMA